MPRSQVDMVRRVSRPPLAVTGFSSVALPRPHPPLPSCMERARA
jgi:hypothetical protein